MSFKATEAAFEGFRIARRKPLTILIWALAYAAFFVACFAIAGPMILNMMSIATALEDVAEPSLQDVMGLMQTVGALMLFILPLSLVFSAVLNTAVARSVVRPEQSRFGYLRLGSDELRVLGVTIILGLVMMAVYVVGFSLVWAAGAAANASGIGALWLPVVLLGIAAIGFLVWLMLRLSLAVPIVVAEQRFAPFASFSLTRGRVLPLLGMAILAGVMTLLVSLLGEAIAQGVYLATGNVEQVVHNGDLSPEDLNATAILQQFGLAIAAWVVLNSLLSALQLAVLYAPYAAAYRDIKGLPHP